uniref:Uncharacterized protein n=1 Tax=Megaselia scalaris TaxID=36166 RepID=T1H363_MEGSC
MKWVKYSFQSSLEAEQPPDHNRISIVIREINQSELLKNLNKQFMNLIHIHYSWRHNVRHMNNLFSVCTSKPNFRGGDESASNKHTRLIESPPTPVKRLS